MNAMVWFILSVAVFLCSVWTELKGQTIATSASRQDSQKRLDWEERTGMMSVDFRTFPTLFWGLTA